ncbi:unnamed protein product [Sphagnum balticum]
MDNGKDLNTQEEFSKFISNFFYLELYYNADPMTPEVQVARAECGESVVPTKVTPDMNEELTKTISQEELSKAILALTKGKALGEEDGLRTESFQKTLKDSTMPDLLNTLIDMILDQGHMSPMALNKGIVILIPKSGDESKSIGNGVIKCRV